MRRSGELVGTVDWDHETREISAVESFWSFMHTSPRRWWLNVD